MIRAILQFASLIKTMFQTRRALAMLELRETRRQLFKLGIVIFLIFLFALLGLGTFTAFISLFLQSFLELEDILLGVALVYIGLTALCMWYVYYVVQHKLSLFKVTRAELAKDYATLPRATGEK